MIRWCSSRYEINLSIKIYNHKKRCRRLLARGCSLDSGGPHLHRQDDVSDSHNVFGVDNRGFGDFADVGNAVNFAKKHDFTAIHGSKIVLDVTAEREVPLGIVSLAKGVGSFVGDIVKPAYSLCGCVPDANITGEYSSKTTTFKEDVNVPIVSTSDHCTLQADLTSWVPPVGYVHLGTCDQTYQHCGARFWYEERIKNNPRNARPKYHRCCTGRRVVLRTYK
ncbi:hypothetical protein Tco_1388112, partial [Tanacetum coccineum]